MHNQTYTPNESDHRHQRDRQGIHAEPAIIFPFGEIANGVLALLWAIEESPA